jgi:hypothetical protein
VAFNGKYAASKRIVVTILRFFDLLFETDIFSNKVSVLIKKKCQESTHSPVSVSTRTCYAGTSTRNKPHSVIRDVFSPAKFSNH